MNVEKKKTNKSRKNIILALVAGVLSAGLYSAFLYVFLNEINLTNNKILDFVLFSSVVNIIINVTSYIGIFLIFQDKESDKR